MLSAKYKGEKQLEVSAYSAQDPLADEVQIRVFFTGLCGTDLHIVHGNMDKRVKADLTFGHEMSGVVEKIGNSVANVSVGDHVTVMPLDWDNTCPACKAGHRHICQNLNFVGIDSPGALQTLWNVKSNWVFKVPMDLSLRSAALVEPVAVAVHDVERAELAVSDKVLIMGGGPIGVLIGIVARNKGAEVRIIELDEARITLIKSLGFETLNPKNVDIADSINTWTQAKGVDVLFEVSGAASAVLSSVEYLKVRGKLIIVAIHPQPREMNLQRVFWRELTIIGVRVYEPQDFQAAIELIASGAIPVNDIITHVVPIKGLMTAVSILEQGLAMKVLIEGQDESEKV